MRSALIVAGGAALVVVTVVVLLRSRPMSWFQGRPGVPSELSREVGELVQPLRRPCVVLRKTKVKSKSYLGGVPPRFPGFVWPSRDKRPLGFLASIDLSEIRSIEWLPRNGLLLFFYDLEKQPWGFDPADRGSWVVLFVPDATRVQGEARPPEGLTNEWRLPRQQVTFNQMSQPPPWDHETVAGLGLSAEQEIALIEMREAEYEGAPQHQMGGFPNPIQSGAMGMECQLASNGIYCGNSSGYNDARAKALRPGAADWRLLLQFDSDEDLNVMWGDGGMLYFWIRESDARNGDFSGTWLVLQCH